MSVHTSLSHIKENETMIRDTKLSDLALRGDFLDTVWYLWFQTQLSPEQKRIVHVLCSLTIDHGRGTASAQTARISASTHNSLHVTLAAGILGLGERHGCAVTPAMEWISLHKHAGDIHALVQEQKQSGTRIPGFGHPELRVDTRVNVLFQEAKEHGIAGDACAFMQTVEQELNAVSSKPVPLNIDGAIAAVLSDMNIDPVYGNAIFLVARVPGLLAQSIEQVKHDEGVIRIPESEIVYKEE